MHLKFDMVTEAVDCNENRHPQAVMRELGITYQHATPQSMGEQWWFWNCSPMSDELPKYLTPLNLNPRKAIGWGLSPEDADKIEMAANAV